MLLATSRNNRTASMPAGTSPALVSPALEWLWRYLEDVPHPHILDCGPVKPATVNVMLRRGAKFYVADLLSPALGGNAEFWDRKGKAPVFRLDAFFAGLPSIPPNSLYAVFSWHLFDLLPRDTLPAIVERLCSFLRPGGALFCLLREPYLSTGPETAWWLEGLTQLGRESGRSMSFPFPALTNRDMERLIPSGSIKTFLTRTARREMLLVREPAC